jgi:dGTPase
VAIDQPDRPALRTDRRYGTRTSHSPGDDFRTPGQRDYDRILHSSAIRRLGGVTQVVAPSEGYGFHNRLTHTIKVAQIARRIAERLLREYPAEVGAHGGLDVDVVEAAALCHDLGHPPFGHTAEETLDELLTSAGVEDGFEGNAQSFRIITKLAIHRGTHPGLNLTRATLDATLKYPWLRTSATNKFGAYREEKHDFLFARELSPAGSAFRSLEAEIMDWADDVAYSIHDLEDFYKAGLIPLQDLTQSETLRNRFLSATRDKWLEEGLLQDADAFSLYETSFHALMTTLPPIEESYTGSTGQRANLRSLTSFSVSAYVRGVTLSSNPEGPHLLIPARMEAEVALLKELIWHYVIDRPGLATLQYGQRKIITELFRIYASAAREERLDIFPHRFQAELLDSPSKALQLRTVADTISSMTDQEAISTHGRLMGTRIGSLSDTMPY